jgi:hypothetical protein
MKKLLVLLMAVLLVVSALPASTFAIAKDDPEFEKFLEEINWSKKSYINYLMEKNWSLDDFGDVSELGTPLSEEGVQTVMEDFELTREELNELLVEFGDIEEGEDVLDGTYLIFNEELYFFTEYYLTADFGMIDEDGEEFAAFLESINWTKEDYLAYLDSKDWGLEYFSDVSELGTPLSEEGVQKVMKDFDLTREELNALLVEYGDIEEGQDVLDSFCIFFHGLRFFFHFFSFFYRSCNHFFNDFKVFASFFNDLRSEHFSCQDDVSKESAFTIEDFNQQIFAVCRFQSQQCSQCKCSFFCAVSQVVLCFDFEQVHHVIEDIQ